MFSDETNPFLGTYGASVSIFEFRRANALQHRFMLTSPVKAISQRTISQQAIDAIGMLSHDWDGYGGLPISAEGLKAAQHFLSAAPPPMTNPEIVPNSYGTVSLEWKSDAGEAYLEIGRTRYSGHITPQYGHTIYIEGQSALLGYEEMAFINRLIYAKSGSPSVANSTQITQPVL
jgi:hypothetical protein